MSVVEEDVLEEVVEVPGTETACRVVGALVEVTVEEVVEEEEVVVVVVVEE